MALQFDWEKVYPDDPDIVHWRGTAINDPEEFEEFLKGPVRDRVTDAEFKDEFVHGLEGLATTGMATAFLENLLNSTVVPLDWEIGEAVAECLLEQEFGVSWPWNGNRDRKTPRASLPGADLVGFLGEGDDVMFLFGEVKTSSENRNPPGVMAGRSGLAHQIDTLADFPKIQWALLCWLGARCMDTVLWEKFQVACTRYLETEGKDIFLVGVLLRDTPPHQDDLRTRGEAIAARGVDQPQMRLDAWYAPKPINTWVDLTVAEE